MTPPGPHKAAELSYPAYRYPRPNTCTYGPSSRDAASATERHVEGTRDLDLRALVIISRSIFEPPEHAPTLQRREARANGVGSQAGIAHTGPDVERGVVQGGAGQETGGQCADR